MPSLRRHHLRDGDVSRCFHHGQRFQDLVDLTLAAVGLDDFPPPPVGDEAHRPSPRQEVLGQRGRRGHRILLGAGDELQLLPLLPQHRWPSPFHLGNPGRGHVHGAVHVQEEPHVGGGVELEFLDHQLARAGRGTPVDAVEAVAGGVVAHAGHVGGDVVGAAAHGLAAGQVAHRRRKGRDVHGGRIDDDGGGGRQVALQVEEAQRVAAAEGHGAQAEAPPLLAVGAYHPALPLPAAEGVEHAAGEMPRQRGVIAHLQPELGQDGAVADLELLLGHFSHLRAAAAGEAAHLYPGDVGPGPQVRQDDDRGHQVGQVVGQRPAGLQGKGPGQDQDEKNTPDATHKSRDA